MFEPYGAQAQRDALGLGLGGAPGAGAEPVFLRATRELLEPESMWCAARPACERC